jgi:hypothetical protein
MNKRKMALVSHLGNTDSVLLEMRHEIEKTSPLGQRNRHFCGTSEFLLVLLATNICLGIDKQLFSLYIE